MTTPRDPREERYQPLRAWLKLGIVAVATLGGFALLADGDAAGAAASAMVVLLVGLPLLRVLWFVVRWFRRGDVRFALVGVFVLLVPLCGFLLSS